MKQIIGKVTSAVAREIMDLSTPRGIAVKVIL